MKFVIHALLPLVFALLAALSFQKNWLNSLDLLLYDSLQVLRAGEQFSDSVIVAIDEQSIEAIGRWPWQRNHHARLVELLAERGARTIVFDVLFADPSADYPDYDKALADAMRAHGRVVLPMYIEPLNAKGQMLEISPTPLLYASAAAVGHAHVHCDTDGVCRSVFLKEGLGLPSWPHLSAAIASLEQSGQAVLTGERAVQPTDYSPLLIYRDFHNYIPYSMQDTLSTVSYIDVLENRIPGEVFNNKIVFVGATAAGVHDILTTPVGRMPGVEITAHIYRHFANNSLISRVHGSAGIVVSALLVFILLTLSSLLTPGHFLLATFAGVLAQAGLMAVLMYGFQLWFPIATVMVASLLFYPLWSWFRLEIAVGYLRRSLSFVQQSGAGEARSSLGQQLFSAPSDTRLRVAGNDVITRTIARLREVSQEAEANRQLLQQSVASLQEGCIVFDRQGQCLIKNRLVEQMFPAWQSNSVFELAMHMHIEGEQHWRTLIEQLFNGEDNFQLELLSKVADDEESEGEDLYVQGKYCQVSRQSQTRENRVHSLDIGIVTLTRITELKASEKARKETLNFISHDLRSPLVSILSLIESAEGRCDSAQLQTLEQIKFYANRNLNYTEGLLQLNRAEQTPQANYSLCDMHAVCDDAYVQVLPIAKQLQCKLQIERSEQACWVKGDFELLQRVLVNLLTNALKYGQSERGVKLSLALKEDAQGAQVRVSVQDWGQGLSAQQHNSLFSRFQRIHAPGQSGVGLGLFFVKTVVKRHGGRIRVISSPGKGCSVRCSFPRAGHDMNEMS